jgi:hypothetical protein
MRVRTLMLIATACAGAMLPVNGKAETAILQEGISDANGPNSAYNMEVGYMTSGFGGVLGPNDANHQIGGLSTNWGRVVLRWDLSSLAGKGNVTDARAKITFNPVVRAEGFADVPAEFSYRLFRISDANKAWIDSEVHRDQVRMDQPWAGSTGAGTAGVDYIEPEVAKVTFTDGMDIMEKRVLTFDFTDTSFLQDWIANPSNNAGFLLTSSELELAGDEDFEFAQGTMYPDDVTTAACLTCRYPDAVAADRPILEIDFTPQAGVAGDYNGNGRVDAADFVLWRDTLGSTTDLRADGDGNLSIGNGDYTVWTRSFGNPPGGIGANIVVPEVSSFALFIIGFALSSVFRRHHRSATRL